MMITQGAADIRPSVQASLASRQYISTIAEVADGMLMICHVI